MGLLGCKQLFRPPEFLPNGTVGIVQIPKNHDLGRTFLDACRFPSLFDSVHAQGTCGSLSGRMDPMGFFNPFEGQVLPGEIILIRIYVDDAVWAGLYALTMPLTFFLINKNDAIRTFVDRVLWTSFNTRRIVAMHTGVPEVYDTVE